MTTSRNRSTRRRARTFVLGIMVAAGVMAVPAAAEAQMGASASGCYPGMTVCQLDLFKIVAFDPPLYLTDLNLTLTNGWQFTSPFYGGQDSFGPFGPFVGALSGPTSLFLDFTATLGFFELNYPTFIPGLSLETFLTFDVDGGSGAPLALQWEASDLGGGTHGGIVTGPPSTVVPEPSTVLLLATGLLAMGALYRRRGGEASQLP